MSFIRGEYWVYNNETICADGDVGDFNHEGVVIEAATASILGMFGLDVPDIGKVVNPVEYIKGANQGKFPAGSNPTVEELIDKVLGLTSDHKEYGELLDLFRIACGGRTITQRLAFDKFAIVKWDWAYVVRNTVAFRECDNPEKKLLGILDAVADSGGIHNDGTNVSKEEMDEAEDKQIEVKVVDVEGNVKQIFAYSLKDYWLRIGESCSEAAAHLFYTPRTKMEYVAALRKQEHESQPSFYRARYFRGTGPYLPSD